MVINTGGEHVKNDTQTLNFVINSCILGVYYTYSILNVFLPVLASCVYDVPNHPEITCMGLLGGTALVY